MLWCRAETSEALLSSSLAIATLLGLPERTEQDQTLVMQAVQRWLSTHSGWLLILDNADDLSLVRSFLLPAFGGHVLLTTRAHAMGRLAKPLEVQVMPEALGALLLLRRAGRLAPQAELSDASEEESALAQQITRELGGLPLALDQAGAYIEETECSLQSYLEHFLSRRAQLLSRRGGMVDDHPDPVATTWSLSFEKVQQHNPAAADLLWLGALLAPDVIPEELLIQGAKHLGPHLLQITSDPLQLDDALSALLAYSLIQREPETSTFSIHRLVQAIQAESMDEPSRVQWIERALRAMAATRPKVEHGTWLRWERLVPHVQSLATHLAPQSLVREAALVFQQTGRYLIERARYQEAQPLLERAYTISEAVLGENHSGTAAAASTLASLYHRQGKYPQAEPLYQHALAIDEKVLGTEHPGVATDLNNLALFYDHQGRSQEAEPLYIRALAICEQQLGPLHPHTASSLHNLALLYGHQGRFAEAEPLYQRALAIKEQQLGPDHPSTASSLHNLAGLYHSQDRYQEAESLYQRALAIREQQLGPLHPHTASSLHNLAALYQSQGRAQEAEPLYVRALAIDEEVLGAQHPRVATDLHSLARLYDSQGRHQEAEPLFRRALAIWDQQLGLDHPSTAGSQGWIAALLHRQGKLSEARALYEQALGVFERRLGTTHPRTQALRAQYEHLLHEMQP